MERPLFGGAVVAALPMDAQDMSVVREIPDNQEVFAHPTTDQSIIIEILEYVQEADEQAIKTHFEDVASSNEAANNEDSQILGVEALDRQQLTMKQCACAYWLMGKQNVSKFHETAKNEINLHMVLYRVLQFTTDILVTFNDPVIVNPESSSHQAVATSSVPWTVEDFKKLVQSLNIVDTGLFG